MKVKTQVKAGNVPSNGGTTNFNFGVGAIGQANAFNLGIGQVIINGDNGNNGPPGPP
jgi:hypothetical protein